MLYIQDCLAYFKVHYLSTLKTHSTSASLVTTFTVNLYHVPIKQKLNRLGILSSHKKRNKVLIHAITEMIMKTLC